MSENFITKYYGEYSLTYWIKLMLKKDIVLPDFQRPYVWEEKDVISFLDSFKKKQFIPPVIIGKFIDSENESNIILDGQQRLCSLIFAYYQIFPNSKEFKDLNNVSVIEYEDDSGIVKEEDKNETTASNATKILNYIQKKFYDENYNKVFHSIDEFNLILENDKNFEKFPNYLMSIAEDKNKFFDENHIPFIYVNVNLKKSDKDCIAREKEYYSNLFYNINKKGIELNNQECRNAIIWLSNKNWQGLFDRFKFKIYISGKVVDPVDFSYYLSLILFIEFKSEGKVENIEKIVNALFGNRYKKEEKEEFILKFLKTINEQKYQDNNEDFGNPNDILEKVLLKNEGKALNSIKKYVENCKYDSVAHFELEFIGLLYWVLLKGKDINVTNYKQIIKKKIEVIEGKGKEEKDKYRRNVNKPNNLRRRIVESINIYK